MEIIYIGERNPSNRALLISNKEWKRLGKILSKKIDEEDALEVSKRLKEVRRETSKKMVDGWNNTELNKTRKLLEQKRKALSELEIKRQQRDEEMKREALDARNKIIEKARKLKFEERDATKTFNRALQHSEVFKERDIQLKFIESEREKKMENDLIMAFEQNKEAEQYRIDQNNEKQLNKEMKRAKAEIFLEELKDRETKRREEEIKLYKSGQAELKKIAEEIEEIRVKTNAEAQLAKEKLQKDIAENQKMVNRDEQLRQTEEQEEEMVTAIMAETKKLLARARRLKEIELTEIKQNALEKMRMRVAAWPTKDTGWAASDIQNALEAQEQRFKNGQHERKALAKRRTEYVESGNKLWKEETAKRKEQLNQDHKHEIESREREKALLSEYAELCRNTQAENAKKFKDLLDKQCDEKTAALMAERQADIDRYEMFERLWQKEDEEFIAYAENIIEKKKSQVKSSNPIVPLLKTVKDYLEKNNLCLDKDNKVSKKKPKGIIYSSRVIHHTV